MTPLRTRLATLGLTPARGLAAALLSLLISGHAVAQKPADVSVGEIAMLPKYCPDTMGFNYGDAYTNTSPRAGYWVGLMGKSFWAMHHYCWGLIKYRRATSGLVPPQVRIGYLQSAGSEWEFVIRNSTPDFVMLPDVYLKMGETYAQLKQYGQASSAFDEARKRKPDYPPPYLRWADVLVASGNKKGALSHLELGLRQAPASPELQAMYKRLGGNAEAFIKALPTQPSTPGVPTPTSASAPSAAASS